MKPTFPVFSSFPRSGIFAGLTLGYMSLDMTQLTILSTSGNATQQAYAKKIMPVRRNGHQLLTTLLLVNMIVNETLPVIADPVLGGGVQAVVVSTVLIIIFAEIIPQSICSRYGLLVGAKAARMTQILIYVAYPVAKPVSLLLEKILGSHNGIIYRKAELRELLNLHAMAGMHGGDLLTGTVHMAQGALDLQDKSVFAHMTPIESVFMLEDTTKLDYEVLSKVVQSGHSRIPVYHSVEVPDLTGVGKTRKIKKILGTMLVKNCVLLDPEDATPIMSIPMSTLLTTVPQDQPLLDMLNAFREGRSHMALVSRRKRLPNVDETDIDEQSMIENAAGGLRERIRKKLAGSETSDSSDDEEDLEKGEQLSKKIEKKKSKRDLKKEKREAEREKAEAERLETKKEGQGVPGDAFLEPKTVDKLMGDIEGETIGIITLEDVLEELIGNEIEDECEFALILRSSTRRVFPLLSDAPFHLSSPSPRRST
ncbi:hypothetical protein BDY24DRAFT_26127 [Mrakia frigida]|uniref:uncharacterized protein n=1 Tax=Mrakia frigida TaxID=29902 RepID=UPI003FCBFD67